jgi:hypothetical protein
MIALAVTCFAPHPGFGSQDFYPGDYSPKAIIGNSLPGTWRPFSDDSPWNTAISPDAVVHPDHDRILATVVAEAATLRLANRYMPPVWVVNSDNLPHRIADSPYPFDTWDQNLDGITEAGVPITATMFGENTADGHISIVDPFKKLAWEMSRYKGIVEGVIDCSTFNIWDLTGSGVGDGNEGVRWRARGGRGSGFPILAGLIRPEELAAGEIRHALAFTFSKNRGDQYLPPAARTDGDFAGPQYPMEGMLFQLDPALTDSDFDRWGLNREGKILARTLQRYGMYNADNGGAMALQAQLLHSSPSEHRALWESRFPGFYDNVKKIPTDRFRVIYTGEPVSGGAQSTVVTPLILPLGGPAPSNTLAVTISTPTRDARITYTTDGSTPEESSTPYTGRLGIRGPIVLQARAFRSGMTPSSVTRALFGEGPSSRPSPPILLDN